MSSTIKLSGVFHVLPRLVKELVWGGQKRFRYSDNMGLLAVGTVQLGSDTVLLFAPHSSANSANSLPNADLFTQQ